MARWFRSSRRELMSVRATIVLLLAGCLGCRATHAFAQQPPSGAAGKWEIEVHAGLAMAGAPTGAKTAMPAPGEPFTTRNARPSRYVSSWYFGDGAALLNEWAVAFTTVPRKI